MLKLNINEEKPLTFEIQLSGINPDALTGYLRFEIETIEYGFPVTFGSEIISVLLPPLKNIINKEIKEGEILKGRLEVCGNGHFLNPWSGEFKVTNSIKIEAKVYDEELISEAPKISVNKVVSEKFRKLKETISPKESKPKKPVTKKVVEAKQPKKKEKKLLENVKKEDVLKFMKYMGTKSGHIQEIIYEQCEVQAGSDKPKDILKEVYKFLNKKNTENK